MASTPSTSASGAMLPAEWSLLLSALAVPFTNEQLNRVRFLAREFQPWNSLLELAERQGVLPLLYQAMSGLSNEIPPDAMRSLTERYQSNLHKSLFLAREMIRILEQLESVGVEVMPYKGVTLAETAYGDMALRQAGDIDLLIRPVDLARIKAAVGVLGYRPHVQLSESEERAYLLSGYECAFDGDAGRNLLEVQWAIQPRFYAVDLAMADLFQRSVTVRVAGRAIKTLSLEDQILVLSVHAAKHFWGRLIWLRDIAQIAQAPGLNWNWIEAQTCALGILRIVRVTLLLANKLLDFPIPELLRAGVMADRVASDLTDEIGAHLLSGGAYSTESVAYFRLMMRLRERRGDRVRFLRRLIFTSGLNEWRAVRLPAALFPLYRVVRLSRLAARLVSRDSGFKS
jgi:hypothetical protein